MISLNPNRAGVPGILAQWYAFAGVHERGMERQRQAIRLNPHFPGWFHNTDFTTHYHRRQFDKALEVTYQFTLPDYFGDPLLCAAVLGQLGHREDASAAPEYVFSVSAFTISTNYAKYTAAGSSTVTCA